MQLYKTVDSDGYLRIEEDCGAAITLYFYENTAHIIALFVPRSDREEGIGSALLAAAEKEACAKGANFIDADYNKDIKGMTAFFEAAGYDVKENVPICSIDTARTLEADKIKNTLKKELSHARFASLEELMMIQWDELLGILSKHNIRISSGDMGRFSQNLSGVVYDDSDTIQAFILCTEMDDAVHIDLLGNSPKGSPSYLIAALQGMFLEVYSSGGAKAYPSITAVCAHDSVLRLMDSVLPEKPDEVSIVMYASKELDEDDIEDVEVGDDPDEDMIGEWRKEIGKVPMQSNISWKISWYRDKSQDPSQKKKDKKDKEEVKEAATGDEASLDEKDIDTATDDVTPSVVNDSDIGQDSNFPYELQDPLDVVYGFEKEEDETDGLIRNDTRRITVDNLDEFRDILPDDAIWNIPRPWYRGLTIGSDDDPSYVVYELKNIDDEADSVSEIKWIGIIEDKDAEGLLEEYTSEVKSAGAVVSAIETDKDENKRHALKDAGFSVVDRESEILSVTIGDLRKLAFVGRKTPEYVLGLKDISERQFKRGIGNCMLNNRKGLLEDIGFLPMDWFEQDISSVIITDNRVTGLLLMHQLPSRRLMVDMLFSSSGDAQLDIIRLMTHSIAAAAEKYPADTPVLLRRHNKSVRAITDKLFPGKKGNAVIYGERKEA